MTAPPTIEWVRRGEVVRAPAPFAIGGTEPYMVISPCGDLFHVWFCEPCQQNLANAAQVEMHVEKGGTHRLVLWCSRRRCYEESTPLVLQIGSAL